MLVYLLLFHNECRGVDPLTCIRVCFRLTPLLIITNSTYLSCFLGPRPLQDKVVIVTGASSGIGEAVSRALAENGAKVALAARRKERCEISKQFCFCSVTVGSNKHLTHR